MQYCTGSRAAWAPEENLGDRAGLVSMGNEGGMSDMGGSQGAGGVGGRPSMGQTAEMGGAREIEHGCHGQPGLQRSGCGGALWVSSAGSYAIWIGAAAAAAGAM